MEPSGLSFENTDKLQLSGFCERLQRYVMVESDFVEDSLVISLDAEFGAGKTTFLKMWVTRLLEERAKKTSEGFSPMPIMLNAWESDYAGDPLVAILGDLTEALEKWEGGDKPSNSDKLKKAAVEAAKDIGWFGIGLADALTGEAATKAGKFAEKQKLERKTKTPDFIQLYQDRKAALKNLRAELSAAFGGYSPKVIVIVDELDRCRPDYAVSYLETIKHVFDVKGMVFVLALNREQFANSVKTQFGVVDFAQYMRKFVHRSVKLPRVTQQGSRNLSQALTENFLEKAGMRILRLEIQGQFQDFISDLFWKLRLCPRQWVEAFRLVGHALQAPAEWQHGGGSISRDSRWAMCWATVLLSALHVKVPGLLERVASEPSRLKLLSPHIIQAMGLDEALWWIQLCLAGEIHQRSPQDYWATSLSEVGYNRPEDVDKIRRADNDVIRGWGNGRFFQESGLKHLAERLLSVATFEDSFE